MSKYSEYLKENKIKTWKTALYIRLSKEDEDRKNESVSVKNQREILLEFLKQNPDMELVDIYIDDGFTGTDFDRPAFMRLKADIESSLVDCVVVKDLNRFGRNYTVGGDLIDNYFVRKNVRFIALNNSVDTADDNMNAAMSRLLNIGFTNIMNESYSAMTSVSIRGTLNSHRRQGKFIGAFACYGYKKSPDDYHKLNIDDEAAEIVRLIYSEFIGGKSLTGITKELNALGIPNPTLYKEQKGFNYVARAAKNSGLWSDKSVRRILQNEMYIGNMVQGRNRVISYKIHDCVAVPREEWYVVPGTHEAIIDRETFEKAQSLFNHHIRSSPITKQAELFAGLVRCADCGAVMSKKTNKLPYGTYRYYKCSTKRKKGMCTNHTIRIDKLEEAVLEYLKMLISITVDYDEVAENVVSKKTSNQTFDNTLNAQIREKERLTKLVDGLYPDYKANLISKDEYLRLKDDYNREIEEIDARIEVLKNSENAEENVPKNDFLESFLSRGTIEKLDRALLVELIDEILVYEGGKIKIKMKCADAFENAIRELYGNERIA